MVRVKNRYLVVNFLYPEPTAKSKTQLPDLVQIHSPTPDALKQGVIVRMIRDGVEDLFGEYGSGMVASGLKGTHTPLPEPCEIHSDSNHSQLLLPLYQHSHNPLSTRSLRDGLGSSYIHHTSSQTRGPPRRNKSSKGQRYDQESGRRGHKAVTAYHQESESLGWQWRAADAAEGGQGG
jgi:hypothetical protein